MAKRYCSRCGSELSDIAEICPECGVRQSSTEGPYEVENQKSPFLAALLSAIIVGLGQVYNGQVRKGVILFIFFIISSFVVSFIPLFGLKYLIPLVVWIYVIYDAHQTAEWNNYYYSKGYR